MSQIRTQEIAYRKQIGKLEGDPVYEIGTIGGFHMVVRAKLNKTTETLGTGPHRAVARAIAKRKNPEMELTELSKADFLEPQFYQFVLPDWEANTDRMRALEQERDG